MSAFLSDSLRRALQDALLAWFAANKRDLPWRKDYSPYGVWISEIMLQQTQMERGVAYYRKWMQRFPSIEILAQASEDEVLKAWEGLGYYTRARNLLKAAKKIMHEHNGVFPSDRKAIWSLPGIGSYTSAAIASIAFGQDVACIDANVERVVARLADISDPIRQEPGKSTLAQLAQELLPLGHAREHNQAMMELGALVCGKKALCLVCPLHPWCLAYKRGTIYERPVLPLPKNRINVTVATGVLVLHDRIYVQKRLLEDVWGGLWEFPGGGIEKEESPEQTIVREFAEETGFQVRVEQKLTVLKHAYTKFNITLHCFALSLVTPPTQGYPAPLALNAASEYRWLTLAEIAPLAMPSAHRKLADNLTLTKGNVLCTLAAESQVNALRPAVQAPLPLR